MKKILLPAIFTRHYKLTSVALGLSLIFLAFVPTATKAATYVAQRFTDVPSNHQYAAAVEYLRTHGLNFGYSDHTFRPNTTLNRGDAVIMLARTTQRIPSETYYKNCYSDVRAQSFANEICYAKAQGWLNAGANNFHPEDNMDPEDMFVIVARAYNINIQNTGRTDYGDTMTRAELADLIYRAIRFGGSLSASNYYYSTYTSSGRDPYSGSYYSSSDSRYITDPYSVRVPDGYPHPWVP